MKEKQVSAIIVDDQHRFSYLGRYLRERFSESLAIVPFVFVILSFLLVYIVRGFDVYLSRNADPNSWFFGNTAALISVTSVISTSMLTFVAVVFSVTLVALQLASQQFSPRVMRTVLRRRTIKFSLGIFVASFVFSLVVLSETVRREEETVPLTSLAVSMFLVFLSIIVLFVFVKALVSMIRVAYIMQVVADETRESIAENLPPADRYTQAELEERSHPKQIIRYYNPPGSSLVSRTPQGVLIGVNIVRIVRYAHEHNCLIRILPRVGDYIVSDEAVVEVYGENELDPQEILSSFVVGPERSLFQDPAFGFRELVDIAVLSLSPGSAVPTSATQAIYRITDLLLEIAKRPLPTGFHTDRTGKIRLVQSATSWQEYVDLAFTEVIEYGSGSSQVCIQLEKAFARILAAVPHDHQTAVIFQQRNLTLTTTGSFEENIHEQ